MQDPQLIDQPAAVREGEALPMARLDGYLRARLPELTGPLEVQQFGGGFSNLTYLLRFGERELVLRRPPFGAQIRGGHDMEREYRLLSILHPVYGKTPRPLLVCADPAVLDAPFYVMERVTGVILRRRAPAGLDLGPERMGNICHALVDTLVELHAIDYARVGLSELGKPQGYTARQVAGWTTRYANARTEPIPELERTAEWLAAHLPPEQPPTLIHNDYKYDNVVLDPAELTTIRAVLDWEMATLGDPLTDVGTTLGYWSEPGDPQILRDFGLTSLPGNLDRRAWVERYAAGSGRDTSAIVFYFVYGLFKNATICQQIYARFRRGATADPRFAGLIHMVRAFGALAAQAIERDRIDRLFP